MLFLKEDVLHLIILSVMKNYILAVLIGIPFLVYGQAPNWSINPASFQYNMTIVAKVKLDLSTVNTPGHRLGAFVGNELRGFVEPTVVNDSAYYFLTVYAQEDTLEKVNFKVFHQTENQLLDALEEVTFESDRNLGSVHTPFVVNISVYNDWPISLLPIPNDSTLLGLHLDTIDLLDYLQQIDEDSIAWTIHNGAGLITEVVENRYLLLQGVSIGHYTVSVTANEIGNSQLYSTQTSFMVSILDNYIGPILSFIPPQVEIDNQFSTGDLMAYTTFQGNALTYEENILPLSGNDVNPNWSPPVPIGSPMNLIIELQFDQKTSNQQGILAGFVNGALAGIASPTEIGGKHYYFLSLFDVGSGNIEFKFFDSDANYLYEINSAVSFQAGGSQGDPVHPLVVELSPILIDLDAMGSWTVSILDTQFVGSVISEFVLVDQKYPSKRDAQDVLFLLNECQASSTTLCPGEVLCASVDYPIEDVVWIKDGFGVADGSYMAIQEPGTYAYYGLDSIQNVYASCLLEVVVDSSCTSDFPIINYSNIQPDTLGNLELVVVDSLTSENMPSEITWTGANGNSNWFEALNWDHGQIPKPCQSVTIPSSNTVILSDQEPSRIWSLKNEVNATLILENNSNLSIRQF